MGKLTRINFKNGSYYCVRCGVILTSKKKLCVDCSNEEKLLRVSSSGLKSISRKEAPVKRFNGRRGTNS